jgi:hypothetical protein
MLIQYDQDRILLFPAWPSEWDVEFKLHAPRNTVIEAAMKEGKIEIISVTPASRKADIIVPAI